MNDGRSFFEPGKNFSPALIGRNREMEWLFDRLGRRGETTVITGVGGVGKTTLLRQFIGSVRTSRPPLIWTPHYRSDEAMVEISTRIEELSHERNVPEIIAVDDSDTLQQDELNEIASRILNFKAVRMLIFVGRHLPEIARAKVMRLEPLSIGDAVEMLRTRLGTELPHADLVEMIEMAGGLPLALQLLANQIRGREPQEIIRLLRGDIYKLERQIIVSERTLITDVKPRILMVNEALIERLRVQPQAIYDLPPRKFEELIAELLDDLGYEVELTPATGDGGKDIAVAKTFGWRLSRAGQRLGC